LLDGVVIDDTKVFNDKLQEWEDYYNYHRPHGALDGQTPYERLRQKTHPAVADLPQPHTYGNVAASCHQRSAQRSPGTLLPAWVYNRFFPDLAFVQLTLLSGCRIRVSARRMVARNSYR